MIIVTVTALTFTEPSPVPGTKLSCSHALFDHLAFSLLTNYLLVYCQILWGLTVRSLFIILESSFWKSRYLPRFLRFLILSPVWCSFSAESKWALNLGAGHWVQVQFYDSFLSTGLTENHSNFSSCGLAIFKMGTVIPTQNISRDFLRCSCGRMFM